jgi:hypothetical protein
MSAGSPLKDETFPLESGPRTYRALAYPSDDAGRTNGKVSDDGVLLTLGPSPAFSIRLWPPTVIAVYGIFTATLVLIDPHQVQARSLAAETVMAFTLLGAIILIFYAFWPKGSRKIPWIVANRKTKQITLARENLSIRFSDVIRLQWVSFETHRHPNPGGELQIVFCETGCEQIRCVVSNAYPDAVKNFLLTLRATTEISISRARYLHASNS